MGLVPGVLLWECRAVAHDLKNPGISSGGIHAVALALKIRVCPLLRVQVIP